MGKISNMEAVSSFQIDQRQTVDIAPCEMSCSSEKGHQAISLENYDNYENEKNEEKTLVNFDVKFSQQRNLFDNLNSNFSLLSM